ncbi:MAG: hypothetical protein V2I27_01050 [Erythrobacter sp.]|jgi:hypothetical protein|nr:hypothetical protein [Erythrobacter sp.]
MDGLAIVAMTIVAIVLIIGVSFNGIVGQQMREKRLRHEAQKGPGSAELRAIAERTAHIEDRLAVLERIATDRGQMLADEIEALRLAHRSADRENAQ